MMHIICMHCVTFATLLSRAFSGTPSISSIRCLTSICNISCSSLHWKVSYFCSNSRSTVLSCYVHSFIRENIPKISWLFLLNR